MRALSVCLVLALVGPAFCDEPKNERVTKLLKSDNFYTGWETIPTYAAGAELEIGDEEGHGDTFGWLWFKPGKDGVDVLSVQYDGGRKQFRSKHPPDAAAVAVKFSRLKPAAYAELLKDLAIVDSAQLGPRDVLADHSSHDFWVSARLTDDKKTLVDLDWAGFWNSREEINLVKPAVAVKLAREAVEKLDFKDHKLTDAERSWASAKFARDWKRYKDKSSHGWMRARMLTTIGVVGDATAIPTLRDILTENKQGIYYAINAVTRLTGKDVRTKPVEEMDVEQVRPKVLELIKDTK